MIRRKHSTQRDQLAKLKAQEILKSTVQQSLAHSDYMASNMQYRLLTGFSPNPTRSDRPLTGNVAALASQHFLSKSIELRHQGKSRASILSASKASRASILSTSRSNKTTNSTKMFSSSSKGKSNKDGRNKNLPPPKPTALNSEIFANRHCYGGSSLYPMMGGGCAMMAAAHAVPNTISVSQLNEINADDSSEISLEDNVFNVTTFSTTTASLGQTTGSETTSTSVEKWPSYPEALVSAACGMPGTTADSQSTNSSISWPSDEEDDDDDSLFYEPDSDDDTEQSKSETEDAELEPSSLKLITEVRELNCTDADVASHLLRNEFGCGGDFKFWKEHERNFAVAEQGPDDDKLATNFRDEENCRDDSDTANTTREASFSRLQSF